MIIRVLAENTARREDLTAEHGLSLHIETGGQRILFDAGQSDAFARNAQVMGVDLAAVDWAVLSHGHYDHSGGLTRFLEINDRAPIYASRHSFGKYYNASGKEIGVDGQLARSPRLRLTGDEERITPHAVLYSCNGEPLLCPVQSYGLTREQGGVQQEDGFLHEQYLLLTEGDRRILISGCSHKGIENIAHWFRPDVLVGGFHFMKVEMDSRGRSVLEAAARRLLELGGVYYTGHCTGQEQYDYLRSLMGDRLQPLFTGAQITL